MRIAARIGLAFFVAFLLLAGLVLSQGPGGLAPTGTEGLSAGAILVLGQALILLGLLATSCLIFHRLVLRRLRRLEGEVTQITASPLLQGRLSEEGSDEIARLARAGNDLIEGLVEAHRGEARIGLLFRSLVDNIPGIVYRSRYDANWTKEYLSGNFEEITGHAVTDFLLREDRSLAELIHPDDLPSVRESLRRSHEGGRPYSIFFRIIDGHGRVRWIFDRGQFLYDPTTSTTWFDGVMFDATREREAQEALALSEGRYRRLFENAPLAFIELDGSLFCDDVTELLRSGVDDLDGYCRTHRNEALQILSKSKILRANGAALSLLGATDGRTLEDALAHIVRELTPEQIARFLRANLQLETLTESDETLSRLDGRRIVVHARWVALPDESGGRGSFLIALEDITERKALEERLLHLSLHDALTGLHNRAFYREQLALFETGRLDPLAVVVTDVDGLKIVNDTLGHDVGDVLLQRVAAILKKSFRESDIVARVGGDEFSVLLPRCSREGLEAILERLRENLAAEEGHPSLVPLVLSVGSAWREDGERPLLQLITEADSAMYAAKRGQRGLMTGRFRRNIEAALERGGSLPDGHRGRLDQILDAMERGLDRAAEEREELSLLALYRDLGGIRAGGDDLLRREAPQGE